VCTHKSTLSEPPRPSSHQFIRRKWSNDGISAYKRINQTIHQLALWYFFVIVVAVVMPSID
jgi:hypothetical protein